MRNMVTKGVVCLVLLGTGACVLREPSVYDFAEWERGICLAPAEQPDMRMFVWFYEWHLFDAVLPGIHTRGHWLDFTKSFAENRSEGFLEAPDIRLEFKSAADGADLFLTISNFSDHEWPELAAIIPCFNPGPKPGTNPDSPVHWNPLFVDQERTHTWFVSPAGLTLLKDRAIHFNDRLRDEVDRVCAESGPFVFDTKWPTAAVDAGEGLVVRESSDGAWVAGIAWERSLSSQGHNPWSCMHLSVQVGPLARGETRRIRGKVYLFRGKKEDCYQRYRQDFPVVGGGD